MCNNWQSLILIIPLLMLLSCTEPVPEAVETAAATAVITIPTVAATTPPEPTATPPPPPPTAAPAEAEPSAPAPTAPSTVAAAEESANRPRSDHRARADSSFIAGETITLQGTAGTGNVAVTIRIASENICCWKHNDCGPCRRVERARALPSQAPVPL
jgi:hypothetical protein